MGEWQEVGEVTHYFPHPEAAIIKLSAPLAKGDTVRIVGGEETDFEQEVASMEVDHEKIEKGKKGDEVGVKVKKKVRDGYKVYKA